MAKITVTLTESQWASICECLERPAWEAHKPPTKTQRRAYERLCEQLEQQEEMT